ncbi:MAG TPA: DsbA family protein [Caulobacteraceae bacterium]|jgi:protein-disulfide isomerase|nr:DsbA family protein [Caulobacteraceae bacterium]
MSRHAALDWAPGIALAAALASLSGAAAATAPEHALGSPKAPVTVVEYASVGCPHCATWANEVFPAFKKQWIDTGKVRFVFHEMITGDSELAVAGFMIADCAPPDRYFQVVDDIFADQAGVAQGGGTALLKVAKAAGMTPAQFDACLTDHQALADLQARTDKDAQDHGVEFTPTFFVNGRKLNGDPTLKDLDAAIQSAERARRKG